MKMDTANRILVEETGAASKRELLQRLVAFKPEFTEEEMRLPNLDGEQLDGAMKIVGFLRRFIVNGTHQIALRKIADYQTDVVAFDLEELEDEEIEELSEEVNDLLHFPTKLLGMMHEIQSAMFLKAILGDEATLEDVACAVSA